jgi:hypothetical protein
MRRKLITWEIECASCGFTITKLGGSDAVSLPLDWGQSRPFQMEYGYSNPKDLCPACVKKYEQNGWDVL